MTYIIKFFVILIFLNSCAGFTYSNLYPAFKNFVISSEIEVDKELFESQIASFAKVRLGRNSVAILSLAYINNGVYQWVSSTNEIIFTKNGKIIKTIGLPYNINILDSYRFEFRDGTIDYLLRLSNPDATFYQKSTFIYPKIKEEAYKLVEIVETSGYKFRHKNYYYFDSNNQLFRTEQKIHPNLPLIEMDFYFK